MNDRITALEEALRPFADFADARGFDRLPDHLPMTQGSRFARRQVTAADFKAARAALAASRAATDCHQPDLVTADRVRVLANALRNGSQADMDGVMVTVSRQACEEAADILAALDLTSAPAVEHRTLTAQDAARVPEIAALIEKVGRLTRTMNLFWEADEAADEARHAGDNAEAQRLDVMATQRWQGIPDQIHDTDAALRAIGGDA